MSGVGAADTTLNPEDYKGFKLAIVAASWHTQVM
ncbi:MAG: 6,7-dimethyl-8-ribityllumazine synthase, partial [Rothia mucilaginosa]